MWDLNSIMVSVQGLFWADNDVELINHMGHALIVFGVVNAIASVATSSPSPYGRYSSGNVWTTLHLPLLNPTVGWMIQESPAFLLPAFMMLFGSCGSPYANKVLVTMFMSHYFHRSFVFPFYLGKGKRVLVIIVLLATLFCAYNGFMQGYHLLCQAKYSHGHLYSTSFLFGAFLFTSGMIINLHSDYTLVNLRKPGETGYKIPKGGMFKYVSCANYFGEILEWWGFFIATWTYPAFAFATFTTIYLAPRAVFHHRFYIQKIKSYPKDRKAVIPFVL